VGTRMTAVRTVVLSAALLLVALTPVHAREPATAGLTPDEVDKINRGEVVVKTRVYSIADGKRAVTIKGYCVINKPPDAAWAVMLDYEKFHEFMPRLSKVKVLEKTKDTMKVTETVSMPVGTLTHTLDLKFYPTQGRVAWTLDKSRKHDIADTSGTWEFLPYRRGGTVVRYTSTVDSGMIVPKFLEEQLISYDLPGVLSSIKRRTESDGTWTKEQSPAAEVSGAPDKALSAP